MKRHKLKLNTTIMGVLAGAAGLPISSCGSGHCASCFGCGAAGLAAILLALCGINKKNKGRDRGSNQANR